LTYDEETEPISAVGLVAPKKCACRRRCSRAPSESTTRTAVFVDQVQYILVICTAISVRLVGLSLGPAQGNGAPRLTMYETDRRVGTDGVAATAVCGTPEGRIFLACEDGALRELEYRAESAWLPWQLSAITSLSTVSGGHAARGFFHRGQQAPPVSALLAYDATRHNLYTCTSSSIEAYALGASGADKPYRIAHLTDLCKAAQAKCPNSPMLEAAGFAVVALDVVTKDESNNVALVVTTSNCA
jgi:nuclear pore complex protein Nup155